MPPRKKTEEVVSDEAPIEVNAPKDVEDVGLDTEKVRVRIPVYLRINGKEFAPGTHIVERHQLETILEIVNKKQRADLAVFTGNNFLVEKIVGGALKITQVEELDMGRVVRS